MQGFCVIDGGDASWLLGIGDEGGTSCWKGCSVGLLGCGGEGVTLCFVSVSLVEWVWWLLFLEEDFQATSVVEASAFLSGEFLRWWKNSRRKAFSW